MVRYGSTARLRLIALVSLIVLASLGTGAVAGPRPAIEPNDNCSGAIDLGAGGTFQGQHFVAIDDYKARNGIGNLGNDVVYWFTLTQTRQVLLDMRESTSLVPAAFTSYSPVLYLRTACEERDSEVAFGSSLLRVNLAAGRYFLIIDGNHGLNKPYRESMFVLKYSTGPVPQGDGCIDPLPLQIGQSRAGNTASMVNDYRSPTVPSDGRDAVFAFTLTGATTIHVDTFGSKFDTSIYIRGECADASSEVAANDDVGQIWQSQIDVALPAATYYLVVDGFDGSGAYTLTTR